MDNEVTNLREKIRQQFDTGPYPRIPLEKSPKNDTVLLYIHYFVNPYYLRNQKVIETEGKLILDAGCGTGYKSLVLAEANPGARVIGIDISEKSVELARQRLHYHGFDNTEFHVSSIEDLPDLGLTAAHSPSSLIWAGLAADRICRHFQFSDLLSYHLSRHPSSCLTESI